GRQRQRLDLGAVLRSPFGPTTCAGASRRAGLLPPAGRRRGAGPHPRRGVESALDPGRGGALLARSRERGGRRGVRHAPGAAGTRGLGRGLGRPLAASPERLVPMGFRKTNNFRGFATALLPLALAAFQPVVQRVSTAPLPSFRSHLP